MKLPLKQLLLALGAAATLYALVLLRTGGTPALASLQRPVSPPGLAPAASSHVSAGFRRSRGPKDLSNASHTKEPSFEGLKRGFFSYCK